LVIDDAVVVVENIFRRMEGGASPDAVWEATAELVAPVVGSTLTTVVVLVPLGLLSGVVGQFFRALSLTLSVAVLLSLFLALWLTPLLARSASRHRRRPENPEAETAEPTGAVAHRRGERLEAVYARALGTVMRRPALAVVGALALAALGVLLYLRM